MLRWNKERGRKDSRPKTSATQGESCLFVQLSNGFFTWHTSEMPWHEWPYLWCLFIDLYLLSSVTFIKGHKASKAISAAFHSLIICCDEHGAEIGYKNYVEMPGSKFRSFLLNSSMIYKSPSGYDNLLSTRLDSWFSLSRKKSWNSWNWKKFQGRHLKKFSFVCPREEKQFFWGNSSQINYNLELFASLVSDS